MEEMVSQWPLAFMAVSGVWLLEYGLYVVGIILSVRRYREGSGRYLYVACFFGLWLVMSMSQLVIQMVLPRFLFTSMPALSAGAVMALSQALVNLVRVAALVALLAGLFRSEEGIRT